MITTFKRAKVIYRQPMFQFARKARPANPGVPGLPPKMPPGMFPPGVDPNDPEFQEMLKNFGALNNLI